MKTRRPLGGPILICDTDAFATTLWHEHYLGSAIRRSKRSPTGAGIRSIC